jgi:hypothetical protein
MQNSSENQNIFLASLPGRSNRSRFDQLISHAREFAFFHPERISQSTTTYIGNRDGEKKLPDGQLTPVSGLSHSQGEKDLRAVVTFLEALRNQQP